MLIVTHRNKTLKITSPSFFAGRKDRHIHSSIPSRSRAARDGGGSTSERHSLLLCARPSFPRNCYRRFSGEAFYLQGPVRMSCSPRVVQVSPLNPALLRKALMMQ